MIANRVITILFGTLILIASGAAHADKAAREKLFIELYSVMRYDSVLAQMTNAVSNSLEAALRQKFPKINQETLKIVREVTEETFSDLKPQMVKFTGSFMVKNFNEGDIRSIIEFYKTPTGQKTLTLMPKMTQEMMAWMVPTMQSLQAGMQSKLRDRLNSRGYKL
jgi:hypothetical protein